MTPETIFIALAVVFLVFSVGARLGYLRGQQLAKGHFIRKSQELATAMAQTKAITANMEGANETLEVLGDELKALNWRNW